MPQTGSSTDWIDFALLKKSNNFDDLGIFKG